MPSPFGGASTTQLDGEYSFRVGFQTPTTKKREGIKQAFQKMNDLSSLLSPTHNNDGPDFKGAGRHMAIKEKLRNKENWMDKLRRIQN